MAYTEADRQRVRELKAEGLSNRAVADKLMIGRRTVDKWVAEDSAAAGDQPPPAPAAEREGAAGGSGAAAGPAPRPGRKHEQPPRKPPGGKVAQPPAGPPALDYSAVGGYIEGAYKLGAKVAVERGDRILGDVIDEHASAAARAWVRWIQSEPRVEEMLRKLLVGTPVGEVIAIHVSIVFSYTLARTAAEQLAAAEAAERVSREPAPAPA